MNHLHKHSLVVFALLSVSQMQASSSDCVNASPYFSIRSQSVDSARELVGWANDYHINLYNMCDFYGSFALTLEGTRSFRSTRIARCIFGDSLIENCFEPTIRVSGSEVQTRGGRDWLADNFFLAPDFESKIIFNPHVSNVLVDFNLYLGLDNWAEGLYFRIHAPIVNTRWKLNPREQIITPGVLPIQAGYFGAQAVPNNELLNGALDTLTGQKSGTALISRLAFSKFSPCGCTLKETKLSDIVWAFGWNFWQCEDYHLGLNIRGAFPTGTRPDGEFLFEPIVGNGHHYELGAGLTSHLIVWRDCDCEQYVGLYLDANITHLFKTRQGRNFDLCNSPNSRYMLALNLGLPIVDDLLGNPLGGTAPLPTSGFTTPSSQFKDKYTYVANLTHADVDVSVGVQADVTFLIDYTCGGYSFDWGYNFWGRSCEKICFKCPPAIENALWALKGDASVYGFPMATTGPNSTGSISGGDPVALSPSESNASIYAGTNRPCGQMFDPTQRQNPLIDNPEFAYSGTFPLLVAGPVGALSFDDELVNQMNTSIDPIVLTTDKIDCQGARTRGISHKIFSNLSYTWCGNECWIPYFGIGAKMEFAQSCGQCNKSCQLSECPPVNVDCTSQSACDTDCKTSCTDCKKCALSEWGVWLKGGVSFN